MYLSVLISEHSKIKNYTPIDEDCGRYNRLFYTQIYFNNFTFMYYIEFHLKIIYNIKKYRLDVINIFKKSHICKYIC